MATGYGGGSSWSALRRGSRGAVTLECEHAPSFPGPSRPGFPASTPNDGCSSLTSYFVDDRVEVLDWTYDRRMDAHDTLHQTPTTTLPAAADA